MIVLGIENNRKLEKLNLSDNDLGDQLGAELLYTLAQNRNLREINLASNFLGVQLTILWSRFTTVIV